MLCVPAAKAIRVQASGGPYGFRRLKFPEFLDTQHMKVLRLSALSTAHLYPRLSRPQVHSVAGRMKSMRIPNDPIEKRTRDSLKEITVKTPDFCITYSLKRYSVFCFTFPPTKQTEPTKASEVLPTYPAMLSLCTVGVAISVMCTVWAVHGQGLKPRITSHAPNSFIFIVIGKYFDKGL